MQYWQSINDQNQAIGLRSYTMTYDPLKRMTGASFAGINGENYTLSGLSYDKNGNIKSMQRNGKTISGFGLMDNLNFILRGSIGSLEVLLTKMGNLTKWQHPKAEPFM